MRIVNSAEEMPKEFYEAKKEAKKAFGDDKIFVEKYLNNPKHIEDRDSWEINMEMLYIFLIEIVLCKDVIRKLLNLLLHLQFRDAVRKKIFTDAVHLAKHVGYKNAGTLEFLVDSDENYYFIEMNPRIQVEHTVTEMLRVLI